MRNRFFIVCAGLILVASATALAQQGFVPPPSGARFLERYRPATATGETRIVGTVVDIQQVPVQNARLQLRDLANGRVEQEGISDENGEYEFPVLQPSTYVVEMLHDDGVVVALSNAGSIARYETLRTLVQVPGRWDSMRGVVRDQNVATYLGVSGQLTMTSRTLELAIEQNITPRDAGEPVSP